MPGVGAFLRRAAMLVMALLGGCTLLLDDGLTSPDDAPAVDASVDAVAEAEAAAPTDAATVDTFVGPPDGACPPPPKDPTLAAWYPFEEESATIVHDCSGHGLDGKLVPDGGFQRVAGRTSGKAIDTGGNHGCFDLGTATSITFVGSAFTVSAWIKARTHSYPDPSGGTDPKPRWFINRFGASGGGWGIGTDDTAVALGFVEMKSFRAGGSFEEAEGTLPKDGWVHIAGIYTPTSMALYVAGKLAAEKLLPIPTPADPQAHGWIGCRGGDEPSHDGAIDDVRIYSRALGPSEISALAQ